MYDRGAAAGIKPFGPVQLEVLKSIYFRDPNGYIIEFTTKTAGYKKGMDPDQNRAREILDRWEADKSVTSHPHGANPRQDDGAVEKNQKQ